MNSATVAALCAVIAFVAGVFLVNVHDDQLKSCKMTVLTQDALIRIMTDAVRGDVDAADQFRYVVSESNVEQHKEVCTR